MAEPTWMGYSVGKWDGDTFVVDTIGFRDAGWLDTLTARPHSDVLHVTERFHRSHYGHMMVTITIEDQAAYLQPWTVQAAFDLSPDGTFWNLSATTTKKSMEHRRISPAPEEPPSHQ